MKRRKRKHNIIMGIFQKIFKFSTLKLDEIERRMEGRYAISSSYPLKVKIQHSPKSIESSIVNISRGGIRLEINKNDGSFDIGDDIDLLFELETEEFDLKSKVVYIEQRPNTPQIYLGILTSLEPSDKLWHYYQVVYPVIMGSSIEICGKTTSESSDPQFEKQVYRGEFESQLVFWYPKGKKETEDIIKFEMIVDNLILRGSAEDKIIKVYELENDTQVEHGPNLPKNDVKMAFKFYKWFILHLNNNFPSCLKDHLKTYSLK